MRSRPSVRDEPEGRGLAAGQQAVERVGLPAVATIGGRRITADHVDAEQHRIAATVGHRVEGDGAVVGDDDFPDAVLQGVGTLTTGDHRQGQRRRHLVEIEILGARGARRDTRGGHHREEHDHLLRELPHFSSP
jgi:hypothetical protein